MKVRCIKLLDGDGKPTDYSPWVKLGGVYPVLAIEVYRNRTRFRMHGAQKGTPALFEPEMFEIVSSIIPSNWVVASTGPGCFDLAPEPWTREGFWLRFFDCDLEAEACFEREKAKVLAADP